MAVPDLTGFYGHMRSFLYQNADAVSDTDGTKDNKNMENEHIDPPEICNHDGQEKGLDGPVAKKNGYERVVHSFFPKRLQHRIPGINGPCRKDACCGREQNAFDARFSSEEL